MKSDARHGYSSTLIELVNRRDPAEVTVRFAKLCIARGVSALEVAKQFSVSKVTVYAWFKGDSRPRPMHEEIMRTHLAKHEGGGA